MSKGITYIRVPADLLKLGISSAYELLILALAVAFGDQGLHLSNSGLGTLLAIDRRLIPRILRRLEAKGYVVVKNVPGVRIIKATDITLMSPADIKMMQKRHQSDAKVTSNQPCPSISKRTKLTEAEKRGGSQTPNTEKAPGYSADFERFWTTYPKKIGKVRAFEAWRLLSPGAELVAEIMTGVEAWRHSEQWARSLAEDGGRYIPAPARFLAEHRWEDEPPSPPEPQRGDFEWTPTLEQLAEIERQEQREGVA